MIRPGDGGPFGRGWVLHRIYVVCQIFLAVVLLAFIVGSLIFTGGRVGEAQNTNWDEVWRWPVFPVPAWILIVPAIVGAFVVLPMCIRTRGARQHPAGGRRTDLRRGRLGRPLHVPLPGR